jgi:predicted transcriptional regulator
LAVDGEESPAEALARSAGVFDAASRDLAELVVRLEWLADAVALSELAAGHRAEITSFAVRSVIAARGLRADYFDASVGEPSWAILLEVFAARLEGRRISMTHLGAAADLPSTTAYERIRRLVDQGLLLRVNDPEDDRITLIDLTDDGADRMRAYFSAAFRLSPLVA